EGEAGPHAIGRDGRTALVAGEPTPDAEPTGPLGVEPPASRITLSPLNQRRWQNFKTNRRGYWSLWIFLVLFVVTLLAEFIANDKPLSLNFAASAYVRCVLAQPQTT